MTQLHVKVDNLYEQVLARLASVERCVNPAALKPNPPTKVTGT